MKRDTDMESLQSQMVKSMKDNLNMGNLWDLVYTNIVMKLVMKDFGNKDKKMAAIGLYSPMDLSKFKLFLKVRISPKSSTPTTPG